ncbi:MAG TPA: hypothetical protein VI756_31395 [Blastocatellia bacterium]
MDQHTFYLIIAVAATVVTLSIIVQALMFINIYAKMKKLTEIASSLQSRAEPALIKLEPLVVQVQTVTANLSGSVESIGVQARETFDKVAIEARAIAAAVSVTSREIAGLARHQAEEVSGTLDLTNAALQRQVKDLDRLLARTQERIELTTTEVQATILNPVRELVALIAGIKRTIDVLLARDRKALDKAFPDEEMFI